MLKKLTPVLFVERIEDQLPFWINTLGFEKTVEVPHENRLGFVILVKDRIELMIQSHDSVAADVPALTDVRSTVPMFFEPPISTQSRSASRMSKRCFPAARPSTAPSKSPCAILPATS